MRIVLDTSCFISALRSPKGAAAALVDLILKEQIIALMDLKLASEYRDVALRPEHVQKSQRTPEQLLVLIRALEAVSEPVFINFKPRPLSPDPNDDMILDLAINGHADVIATQNKKHFVSAALQFGIQVLLPAEILQRIREKEFNA